MVSSINKKIMSRTTGITNMLYGAAIRTMLKKSTLNRFTLLPSPCPLLPEKGFTLLELLLAMVILSFVLIAIYETLSVSSRAWEKGENAVEKLQRTRVVMDLLSREIKSAFPYVVTPSEKDTHKKFYAFEGKKNSISFVSSVPLRGERGGLSWLSFWVEEGEGLVVLERDALRTDIFKDKDFKEKKEMEVLDENIVQMQLEYFELKGKKEEGEGEGEWKEQWDAEKEGAMPHAVSIALTFKEEGRGGKGEERFSREMVIPLMINSKKLKVGSRDPEPRGPEGEGL